MDRFRELSVFVAVAEAESFAEAARQQRMSPPAVTRIVAALEERLGARLINRTTRSLSLTEAGQRMAERARRLLADLDETERDIIGEASMPQGHLTVTASVTFGRMALGPIIGDFLTAHPRLSISLILVDRQVSLVEEGIDVAVRIGALPDSQLIARRIGEVQRVTVASPDYLRANGDPGNPADLRDHQIISFTGLAAGGDWRFETEGRPTAISLAPDLEVNDAAAAIAAAEAGFGITTTLSYMVGERIRQGRLAPVLQSCWPRPIPVQLVYPHSRLLAAKVRTFVDWASPQLAAALPELTARS